MMTRVSRRSDGVNTKWWSGGPSDQRPQGSWWRFWTQNEKPKSTRYNEKSTQVVSQAVLAPWGSCNRSWTHGERMPQIHGCFDQPYNIVSVCLFVAWWISLFLALDPKLLSYIFHMEFFVAKTKGVVRILFWKTGSKLPSVEGKITGHMQDHRFLHVASIYTGFNKIYTVFSLICSQIITTRNDLFLFIFFTFSF